MFNPMLAAEGVLGAITYPKVVMPKLNGVRGVNQGGVLMARSLKTIQNTHTYNLFSHPGLQGLDGELIVGEFNDEEVFTNTSSGVRRSSGEPDVVWHIFDCYHPTLPYIDRLQMRDDVVRRENRDRVCLVPYKIVNSDAELVAYSDEMLALGYEGLVLRDPAATYKTGRSTAEEGGFMRYCAWLRSEAVILSITERQINLNESKKNELGHSKKSSHKENKIGSGQAGVFSVRDIVTNLEFNMTIPGDALQKAVQANPENFLGELAHYKFKPPVKIGGKPRTPQYEGIRDRSDM